jgi:hypothetical protein
MIESFREHPWHERFSAPVHGESGLSRVYFAIDSTPEYPFDPDTITADTGLKPYLAFRAGEQPPGEAPPYRFSSWALAAPGGRTQPIAQQLRGLYAIMRETPAFESWAKRGASRLRFDLNIGRSPLTVRIDPAFVGLLDDLGSEIESNTLWWREPAIVDGACLHCGIAVPAKLEYVRRFVGGWRKSATCRLALAYEDVGLEEARMLGLNPGGSGDPDRHLDCRLGDDLWVYYFPTLRLAQFAGSPQSTLEPERVIDAFLNDVRQYVLRLSMTSRGTLDLDVKDYGDIRGASSGFSLNRKTVKAIAALNASFAMHLRFGTEPWFDIEGTCGNCSLNVLSEPSSQAESH